MLAFAFLAKFNSGKRGFQFKHKFEMYLVSVVEMPATDRLQFLQILLTASNLFDVNATVLKNVT